MPLCFIGKNNIHFGIIMSIQERNTMSLHRLGSDDEMQNIRDLYGVHNSTLSKIVREFCSKFFVQTSSESQFRVSTSKV